MFRYADPNDAQMLRERQRMEQEEAEKERRHREWRDSFDAGMRHMVRALQAKQRPDPKTPPHHVPFLTRIRTGLRKAWWNLKTTVRSWIYDADARALIREARKEAARVAAERRAREEHLDAVEAKMFQQEMTQ